MTIEKITKTNKTTNKNNSKKSQNLQDLPNSLELQDSSESPKSLELQDSSESPKSLELQDIDDDFENIVDIRCFNVEDQRSGCKEHVKQSDTPKKENADKKVSFNDTVQIKIVENYIKDMNEKSLSKNDLISALNIIKMAIFRKTFRENEIKIVVDFHNRLKDIVNSINYTD